MRPSTKKAKKKKKNHVPAARTTMEALRAEMTRDADAAAVARGAAGLERFWSLNGEAKGGERREGGRKKKATQRRSLSRLSLDERLHLRLALPLSSAFGRVTNAAMDAAHSKARFLIGASRIQPVERAPSERARILETEQRRRRKQRPKKSRKKKQVSPRERAGRRGGRGRRCGDTGGRREQHLARHRVRGVGVE